MVRFWVNAVAIPTGHHSCVGPFTSLFAAWKYARKYYQKPDWKYRIGLKMERIKQ